MEIPISKQTQTRLIKDIKEAMKYGKENSNIFYKHSEDDMLVGYALIIGDDDSPYRYGNYMFKFKFPANYPFSPPKVKFLTNDGVIRYHPNLYKNGTCCLSILNTWKGDQWTSCQTILSVLLSMSSIFQNNSLILEPGIRLHHPDVDKYNKVIEYKNLDFAIHTIVEECAKISILKLLDEEAQEENELFYCIFLFREEIVECYKKNAENIIIWSEVVKPNDKKVIHTSMYHINLQLNYEKLLTKLHDQTKRIIK